VDINDRWRHIKWLAMMNRRLKLAWHLLKPTGIMVVTIDDYEMHHLRCLIEKLSSREIILGVVPIKSNPAGRSTVSGFAVSHEYAIFVGRTESAAICRMERTAEQIARYKERDEFGLFEWTNFRKHGGTNTYRTTRPRQYYPFYVLGNSLRIPKMNWNKDTRNWEILEKPLPDETEILPKDSTGAERIWDFGVETANENIAHLKVKLDSQNKLGIYRKCASMKKG
jgi:adenine-specific DNA-methyltransferase